MFIEKRKRKLEHAGFRNNKGKRERMNSQKNMKGKTGIALLAAGVLAASGMGAGFAGMAYAADPVTAAAGQIVINPADPSTTTEYNY